MKSFEILFQNHKNHENHRIPCENHEKIMKIFELHVRNMKIIKIIELHARLTQTMKILAIHVKILKKMKSKNSIRETRKS